uniref:Uncharacterized protein n=1 Tax=Setaria viridis TaxID=4556 RepID=A0A4U6U234_SETVI|nr:hypothetical protein SEVIR_6G110800v2 [Setaria viridis]
MDAEKAAALAMQDRLPVIEEVIKIKDDLEPPVAEVDPGSARTTQTAQAMAKASDDRATTIQAAPKKLSPTIKPLRLIGEPLLKLRILTRGFVKSSSVDLGGPSLRPVTDGGSYSVQNVTLAQASLQLENQPTTTSNLAPEQQVPEDVVATTSGTMDTVVAPELEVEIEVATMVEVMAVDLSFEPGPSTTLAVVPVGGMP